MKDLRTPLTRSQFPVGRNGAKWDGTTWSSLDSGTNGSAADLVVSDDGLGGSPEGTVGYVGGYPSTVGGTYASRIARGNGSAWSNLDYACNPDGDGGTGDVDVATLLGLCGPCQRERSLLNSD